MLDKVIPVIPELKVAILQTFYMVSVTVILGVIFGTLVGTLLYLTRTGSISANKPMNTILNAIVNFIRSFPFLILAIAIVPLTRLIVGTSIGTTAAIVPLTISCIPYFARFVESALLEVNRGVIEARSEEHTSELQSRENLV